jgi:hypothetical protein
MKTTVILTQEAAQGRKFIAHRDAIERSNAAELTYTLTQKEQARRVFDAVRSAFIRSKVYLTFRKDFYTVSVYKPSAADKLSTEAVLAEAVLELAGAVKVVSPQSTLYRIARV